MIIHYHIQSLRNSGKIDQSELRKKEACPTTLDQDGIEPQKYQLLKNNTIMPLTCGVSAAPFMKY